MYRGRGRGNSKLQGDKIIIRPKSLQHCYKGRRILVGAIILKDEMSMIQNG